MKTETAIQFAPVSPAEELFEGDPFFETMRELQEAIGRRAYELFETGGFASGHELEHWLQAETEFVKAVPLEVTETAEAFVFRAEVPGFTEKDLEIRVEPRRIYISGKREETEPKKGKTVYS